jgi:hypothetical protein
MDFIEDTGFKSLLPQWYLDKKAKDDAQAERNAWAYALRSLRQMERDGYNVFAGFDNVAQIRACIACYLYTYDIAYFTYKLVSGDILLSGDIKDFQQLNKSPTFWKGSKKDGRIILPHEIDDKSTKGES